MRKQYNEHRARLALNKPDTAHLGDFIVTVHPLPNGGQSLEITDEQGRALDVHKYFANAVTVRRFAS